MLFNFCVKLLVEVIRGFGCSLTNMQMAYSSISKCHGSQSVGGILELVPCGINAMDEGKGVEAES